MTWVSLPAAKIYSADKAQHNLSRPVLLTLAYSLCNYKYNIVQRDVAFFVIVMLCYI